MLTTNTLLAAVTKTPKMKNIRDTVEEYIKETGGARFEDRQGEGFGVVFHDENEFFLLSDLAYNSDLGFFRVSRFPNQPRIAEYKEEQLPPVKFSTVQFPNDGLTFFGLVTDDETKGYIIGPMEEVLAAHAALTRLIESGKADEETHDLDQRLGHIWLSVSEASEQFNVPADTVRYAARNGHISMAEKRRKRDWTFPQRRFLYWLAKVYKPRGN